MPIWGPHLYQSDLELQTLDSLAQTASRLFPDPSALCSSLLPSHLTLRAPISPSAVVQQLESGILNRLLHHYKHTNDDLALILLGTVAMELGVKFKAEDMLLVKMCVMKTGVLGGKRKEEVVKALEGYENDGTGWVFRREESGEVGRGDGDMRWKSMDMRRVMEEIERIEKE